MTRVTFQNLMSSVSINDNENMKTRHCNKFASVVVCLHYTDVCHLKNYTKYLWQTEQLSNYNVVKSLSSCSSIKYCSYCFLHASIFCHLNNSLNWNVRKTKITMRRKIKYKANMILLLSNKVCLLPLKNLRHHDKLPEVMHVSMMDVHFCRIHYAWKIIMAWFMFFIIDKLIYTNKGIQKNLPIGLIHLF